ncbi:hypothetical protein, partial [uncultured Enterococcus sp.]|uniref:hypothetical protein n=1 Tax=uncultured Enterococcus sp. TaxID=167972 RepID=UPI0025953090
QEEIILLISNNSKISLHQHHLTKSPNFRIVWFFACGSLGNKSKIQKFEIQFLEFPLFLLGATRSCHNLFLNGVPTAALSAISQKFKNLKYNFWNF